MGNNHDIEKIGDGKNETVDSANGNKGKSVRHDLSLVGIRSLDLTNGNKGESMQHDLSLVGNRSLNSTNSSKGKSMRHDLSLVGNRSLIGKTDHVRDIVKNLKPGVPAHIVETSNLENDIDVKLIERIDGKSVSNRGKLLMALIPTVREGL